MRYSRRRFSRGLSFGLTVNQDRKSGDFINHFRKFDKYLEDAFGEIDSAFELLFMPMDPLNTAVVEDLRQGLMQDSEGKQVCNDFKKHADALYKLEGQVFREEKALLALAKKISAACR